MKNKHIAYKHEKQVDWDLHLKSPLMNKKEEKKQRKNLLGSNQGSTPKTRTNCLHYGVEKDISMKQFMWNKHFKRGKFHTTLETIRRVVFSQVLTVSLENLIFRECETKPPLCFNDQFKKLLRENSNSLDTVMMRWLLSVLSSISQYEGFWFLNSHLHWDVIDCPHRGVYQKFSTIIKRFDQIHFSIERNCWAKN